MGGITTDDTGRDVESATGADGPLVATVDGAWARVGAAIDAEVRPVPLGFADIDNALGGGMRPGTLTVVAGVSGVGVTTLTVGVAVRTAMDEARPVGLITLADHPDDLLVRAICLRGRGDYSALMRGSLSDADRLRMAEAGWDLARSDLTISRPRPSPAGAPMEPALLGLVRAEIGRGAELVVVDGVDVLGDGAESTVRALSAVAQETGAVVLVTTALPCTTSREGVRFSVLEAIDGQARIADAVLIVHRPDRWDSDDPRASETDLLLVKNPVGAVTSCVVGNLLRWQRFVDLRPD